MAYTGYLSHIAYIVYVAYTACMSYLASLAYTPHIVYILHRAYIAEPWDGRSHRLNLQLKLSNHRVHKCSAHSSVRPIGRSCVPCFCSFAKKSHNVGNRKVGCIG